MTARAFSFAEHANGFDQHIGDSIPGYGDLCAETVKLSERFVQDGTNVIDIGCTTGALLRNVRDVNEGAVAAQYLGLDREGAFSRHWAAVATQNVRFHVDDVRTFDGLQNVSFASSLFTLQFIPPRDRIAVLRKVYEGMIEGGAFVVAEKLLANSARLQDTLAFEYYDFKRRKFSAEEILVKERGLRRQMQLWDEQQLHDALCEAGFAPGDIQRFWQRYMFVGLLAVKRRTPTTDDRQKGLSRDTAGKG